jgi:hypothetical protein
MNGGKPRHEDSKSRVGCALRWLLYWAVATVVLVSIGALALRLPDPFSARALGAHRLESARVLDEKRTERGELRQDIELTCSCGRTTRVLVRYPAGAGSHRLALLLGGRGTGRRAVDLVPPNDDWVVAALDYPATGPLGHDLFGHVRAVPRVRSAIRHVVPSIRLALDYLTSGPGVRSRGTELVGVSLGTFFVTPAAVTDARVRRLWLMDGAADIRRILDRALQGEIHNGLLRWLASRAMYELAYGPRLEPARWLGRLAPREVVMVNSRDDRRMPLAAVEALHAAAHSPKRVVWLPGRHVMPTRERELEALARVFFSADRPKEK